MTDSTPPHFGISGRLAAAFQNNPLTPVLALLGLLLGLVAVAITPREEEPQIDVTMANVIVPFPGASARDVEQLISTPLEEKLSQIEGVKHVYSVSQPGRAVLTVEFAVGVPRQPALVRLYNQVFSNQDWLPAGMDVGPVLVKPKGIDDVPVMAITLWTDDIDRSALDLAAVAHTLETQIKRIDGTRDVYTIGAPQKVVLVSLDPAKLASYNLTVAELSEALKAANAVQQLGERVGDATGIPVSAGTFLADAGAVATLVVGLHKGDPVHLADVATVRADADLATSYVWHGAPPGRTGPSSGKAPAVTIAVAKKPGANAADITAAVRARLSALQGEIIPQGVQFSITRDYGQTATDKAQKLIQKLALATASVILLVLFALGWREAVVVGSAVVLTLAMTLLASWALGFTLNRVSLFALIFSIGILVDDAIVVVENIHRHMAQGNKTLFEAIPAAVDEVGGPTILATFTVIAALLPMAFVSGLMGPYMRPIPTNASVGMLISLAIALVVTPWLCLKLLGRHVPLAPSTTPSDGRLQQVFNAVLRPFLEPTQGTKRRRWFYAGVVLLMFGSASLAAFKLVVLKMLPFDNKSEFQIIVDLPEGRTLEDTSALLSDLAAVLDGVPEVLHYQSYAGTAAPINFNGLVRQYFLRAGSNVGDLQVNLIDKHLRQRQSHHIARALRPALAAVAARHGAAVKVVEVPPGPPVLSPVVAEVYGPDYDQTRQLARALQARFVATSEVVDVDSSVESDAPRETFVVNRARATRLGVSQATITQALGAAIAGIDATFVQDGSAKYPRPVRLRLAAGDQADVARILALHVRSNSGQLVALAELLSVERSPWDGAILHKDLLPVVYVTGDEAGPLDSPLYGMFDLVGQLNANAVNGQKLAQHFIEQPTDTSGFSVKWDGEWQITYETFRDMGIAYAAGVVLIYLLLVAQFRSYLVPMVIMVPIPLTVIGVMPGHALLGAPFTATSMIGMIALAGIIVRNSILLVDFVNQSVAAGASAADAVIEACAVRAKPILLTGVAAMIGAFFILDDPIFNGLAIALIFGIAISTALTLLVIPLLYFALLQRRGVAGAVA